MQKYIPTLTSFDFKIAVSAQSIESGSHFTPGYIKNGTVQNSSHVTIGYGNGVKPEWAAVVYFFFKFQCAACPGKLTFF